jgi:hypothetical protein
VTVLKKFGSLVSILILLLGMSLNTQASLYQVAYAPATAFYKSPESLFVSGYASKSDLLAQIRQSYTDFKFEASIGKKKVQVQNDQILREINVSSQVKIKKATPLYSAGDLNSSSLMQLKKDQLVEIDSVLGAFARVKLSSLKSGYVLTSTLEIIESDSGQWINMLPLSLKFEPESSSKQRILVPALTRLHLLKIKNGFGLFKTASFQGYAPLSEVVGRIDFAQYAWDKEKKVWERALYRIGNELVVIPSRKVNIEKFTAFKGTKNRALVSGEHPTLSKGTRIDLVRPQAIRWTQSEIKGHGLVWWQRDLLAENLSSESITNANLLKKNLNGISYDSKTKKGLASAGGIYRTTDGKIWNKISFFGNDDWPVCLHPSGVWFVGAFRSTDEGKTFEPSLKYSDLAKLLQGKGKRKRAFIHLKVLDLVALPKSYVMMKVDTGVTVAKLKSHVLSNNWFLQP